MEKANVRSSVQAGVTVTKPSREMELSLDVNRIPRGRRNPKMEKETDHQVQVKEMLKYQSKLKGKSCSVPPCHGAGTDPVNSERSRKSQHESVKAPRLETGEVVRYMSNVPGFLQRMEKGEDIQGKALNVGVVDWRRLEKLKGGQQVGAQSEGNGRMPASGMHMFTRSQDFESTSKGSLDGQKIRGWNHKPFDKKVHSKVGSSSLDPASSEGQIGLRENSIAFSGDSKRHQARKTSGVKVVADRRSSRSFTASSSEMKGCDVSLVPKDKNMGHRKFENKAEEASRNSTTMVSPEGKLKHGEKVVLLVPRKRSQGSFSEEPLALPSGSEKIAYLNGISDDCSHDRRSSMISSDNPRSFPLPPRLDTSKLVHGDSMLATAPRTELSSAKHISKRSLDNFKFARDYDSETQTVLDTVRKDRHPSPTRGFPFTLGRLTRSFSSKESATIPPLRSTYESMKSGPVTSQSCAGLSIPTGEITTGPSRAKSSPLRRLLDPLFKSKASKSTKENANFSDLEQTNDNESIQHEKHEEANIQAVLHVTVNNGLPVFKFLVDKVDGKASILAATKNVSSPRKSNSGCSYTFYSIDEIKKRSNSWISRGSKDERCEYTYNVIGQMNVNHSPFLGLTGEYLTGHETFSEYVLFGLELGKKLGEASSKLRPSRELGAVIVRTHCVNIGTQKQGDSARSEQSSSVTAILPAAVHGLPEKGGPWPLIQRWRSGGSCDCGGWDVGCGLCVLSAAVQVSSNGFQLFAEGGGSKEGKPVFVMRPAEKGMYSIEFNRRMSLVQAFFISVTVIHSQKPSDLVDLTMEKVFLDTDEPARKMIARDIGATTKFAPSPPLSPVGRV